MRIDVEALRHLLADRASDAGGGRSRAREAIWDDEIPGFGVRARAWRRASFVLKYRVKGETKQRWLTLGEWPGDDAEAMRAEAVQIKKAAALGIDMGRSVATAKQLASHLRAEASRLRRIAADAEAEAARLTARAESVERTIGAEIEPQAGLPGREDA